MTIVYLNPQMLYVMKWLVWFASFGGDKPMREVGWLGWVRTRCVYQRRKVAWVFTISKPSISLYYQSKVGTYKVISHHSFIGSSRHGISPMGTFYQLNLGNHLSFAWRSILATQSIVWRGHQWQVRKGHSLNILRDKWLNEPSTFKLTSRLVSVLFDARVSLLTDPYTRAWKAEMITQIFSPSDALTILSIPLSFRLLGDRMTCAYTSKGDFTIRSAYKIALDEVINGNLGEALDNQNRNIFWKTL